MLYDTRDAATDCCSLVPTMLLLLLLLCSSRSNDDGLRLLMIMLLFGLKVQLLLLLHQLVDSKQPANSNNPHPNKVAQTGRSVRHSLPHLSKSSLPVQVIAGTATHSRTTPTTTRTEQQRCLKMPITPPSHGHAITITPTAAAVFYPAATCPAASTANWHRPPRNCTTMLEHARLPSALPASAVLQSSGTGVVPR